MIWRPPSVRNDPGRVTAYDGPFEGVPPHLAAPIVDWLDERFRGDRGVLDDEILSLAAVLLRFPGRSNGASGTFKAFLAAAEKDSGILLDLVDFGLKFCNDRRVPSTRIKGLLELGGSVWTVGTDEVGDPCLERRVLDTTKESYEQVVRQASGSLCEKHLREAWHEAYGRNPDPNESYAASVKAVEAAACPLVLPNELLPTLGKVIGTLRSAPHVWTFVLGKAGADDVVRFAETMDLIWSGHHSRHSGGPATRDVSQEEAEAAVHLAVAVVQQLLSSALRRR